MNYTYEVASGLLISLIPIYFLNFLYNFIPHIKHELGSYQKNIMYIPLFIITTDIIIAKFLDGLFDKNAKIRPYLSYIKGAIMGLILAFFSIYYWKLDAITGIQNIIYYYASFAILFSIICGFVINYILKASCA